MHTPVVATADADARIMVLRGYDPEARIVRFHTDWRAPKAAMIGHGAPVGVLFYDKQDKVQIRCHGQGRIDRTGPIADAAWASSTRYARRCYLGDAPGARSDVPTSGLPMEFEGVEPTEQELILARANFAVLLVELVSLDWFSLAHTGHRRARFVGEQGEWLTP